jgi:hypothetical protein
MDRLLGADRTDRALIDRILNATGVQIGIRLDHCHSVRSHIEYLGADLDAQSTTNTEILIDCGVCHYSLLLVS